MWHFFVYPGDRLLEAKPCVFANVFIAVNRDNVATVKTDYD